MKKLWIALVLCTVISTGAFAQQTEINWLTFPELEAAMKKEPRKVIVDVYTKWCGPCKMMNNTTFRDAKITEYVNREYYAVKFDAEGGEAVTFKGHTFENPSFNPQGGLRNSTHDLTKAIAPVNGRIAYPTIVYMDEELNLIAPVQGYRAPADFLPLLEYIDQELYKKELSYDDYLKQRKQ